MNSLMAIEELGQCNRPDVVSVLQVAYISCIINKPLLFFVPFDNIKKLSGFAGKVDFCMCRQVCFRGSMITEPAKEHETGN